MIQLLIEGEPLAVAAAIRQLAGIGEGSGEWSLLDDLRAAIELSGIRAGEVPVEP